MFSTNCQLLFVVNPTSSKAASPHSITCRTILPGTLVVCATLIAYLPALSGDFIWNDSDYVTAPSLRSLAGLARIWTQPGATQQYYPLLHSAFWVQHWIFGDNPLGYHLVTLVLHAGSAVLFALILRRLFASQRMRAYAGAAWLAALLFALHPVHVESVAWITEQKNTLSLTFYLAAALGYLDFDDTRRHVTYLAALGLFLASLWCKTVTATLPAALLVIFWWKRGRIDWRRDVLPLLPWFSLGTAAGMFSSWVETTYVGAQGADFHLALVGRALVAGRAAWFYAANLVWPFGLNFVYPRWTVDAAVWWQWLFPLGVFAIGIALWALRQRTRTPLAACLFFVGSLFPVLGFVNLYGERYSWVWDHWQYLADLSPLALFAAGLTEGWQRLASLPNWLGPGLVGVFAVALGGLTWSHCWMFHDDLTLYNETLARNPGCWLAHNNLGTIFLRDPKNLNAAVSQFEETLRLNPDFAQGHNNLGVAWSHLPGRLNDAIAQYKEALRLDPDFAGAHNNLGDAWSKTPGRLNDAIAQYEAALRLDPDFAEAHNNLGLAMSQSKSRLNDAVAQYNEALRLKPSLAGAHFNLGNAWAQMPGRRKDAINQYKEALRLQPEYAEAHAKLGEMLADSLGGLDEAVAQLEIAEKLKPESAEVSNNLATVLERIPGRQLEAISAYEAAVNLKPDDWQAHYNLGRLLIGIPSRRDEAINHLEKVTQLAPDYADAHTDLGLALATIPGRFEEAVRHFESATRSKPDAADTHFNLGTALAQMVGRQKEAVEQFQVSLRINPTDAETHQSLGCVLANLPGRTDEAIEQFEIALRLNPNFVAAHYNIAALLQASPARLPEAIQHLETAVNLAPADANLRELLAKLKPRP